MAKIDNNFDEENQKRYYEEKITSSGFKVTKPRDVIIDILSGANNLLTADDVYMEVKNVDLSIGVATVYRTLELLTRLKIVCRIILGSGRSYYMLSRECAKKTFIYMICNNCKKIITNNQCLKDAVKVRLRENAEETILKNCKLQVDNYQILFTGLCDDCSETR
ncbi:MAG: transcriptional repressor [Actinobacteria bacterium]|nr:transcriptional repressor [Actinomycetota bacterium]